MFDLTAEEKHELREALVLNLHLRSALEKFFLKRSFDWGTRALQESQEENPNTFEIARCGARSAEAKGMIAFMVEEAKRPA